MKAQHALIVAFASLSQPAFATNWYVDNAAPNSAGNGKSWAAAFRSFSAIPWSSVAPGDRILISGGPTGGSKTYTESWSVGASGAAGKPITVTLDASDGGHNGTVIFDYDGRGDRGTGDAILVSNRSNITFSGNVGGERHLTVANFRNVIDRIGGTCLGGYGNASIVVDHMNFVNCNNGVRFWSGKGGSSEVKDSNFQQIRGDAAINLDMGGSAFDQNKIHHNTIELLNNTAVPPGGSYAYVGPDGIQPGSGISIYSNTIRVRYQTSVYTSNQHTDDIQFGMARYLKIYNNEFVNVGDSVIDLGTWSSNVAVSDVWIFNNVFRIETSIDPYPQYIRLYANPGNIASLNNIKIVNNLFLDGAPGWPVIDFNSYGGSPTASGVEIKNNIFYNTQGIQIAPSAGFTASSFDFADNIYYSSAGNTRIAFGGTTYTPASWQSAREPSARLTAPSFVRYATRSATNDLHLAPNDAVARKAAETLSYFAFDKDFASRALYSVWDIGPYQSDGAVLGPPTNVNVR